MASALGSIWDRGGFLAGGAGLERRLRFNCAYRDIWTNAEKKEGAMCNLKNWKMRNRETMESYRPGAWRAASEGGWRVERVAASVCLVVMASSTPAKLHLGGGAKPARGGEVTHRTHLHE